VDPVTEISYFIRRIINFQIFEAKNSDDLFLVINTKNRKNYRFYCSLYTYILGSSFSHLLEKDHFPTYFLCKISFSNVQRPVHALCDSPTQNLGNHDPQATRIDAYACLKFRLSDCEYVMNALNK